MREDGEAWHSSTLYDIIERTLKEVFSSLCHQLTNGARQKAASKKGKVKKGLISLQPQRGRNVQEARYSRTLCVAS